MRCQIILALLALSLAVASGEAGGGGDSSYEKVVRQARTEDIMRQAEFANDMSKQQKVVNAEELLALKIEKADNSKKKEAEVVKTAHLKKAETKAQADAASIMASHDTLGSEPAAKKKLSASDEAAFSAAYVTEEESKKKTEAKKEAMASYKSYEEDLQSASESDAKRQAVFKENKEKEAEMAREEHTSHEKALGRSTHKREAWQIALEKEAKEDAKRKMKWLDAFKKAKARLLAEEHHNEAKHVAHTHLAVAAHAVAAAKSTAKLPGDTASASASAAAAKPETAPHAASKLSPKHVLSSKVASERGRAGHDAPTAIDKEAADLASLPHEIEQARKVAVKEDAEVSSMEKERQEGAVKASAVKQEREDVDEVTKAKAAFLHADEHLAKIKTQTEAILNHASKGPAWQSILGDHSAGDAAEAAAKQKLAKATEELKSKKQHLASVMKAEYEAVQRLNDIEHPSLDPSS